MAKQSLRLNNWNMWCTGQCIQKIHFSALIFLNSLFYIFLYSKDSSPITSIWVHSLDMKFCSLTEINFIFYYFCYLATLDDGQRLLLFLNSVITPCVLWEKLRCQELNSIVCMHTISQLLLYWNFYQNILLFFHFMLNINIQSKNSKVCKKFIIILL